jgi:hypothetical protein
VESNHRDIETFFEDLDLFQVMLAVSRASKVPSRIRSIYLQPPTGQGRHCNGYRTTHHSNGGLRLLRDRTEAVHQATEKPGEHTDITEGDRTTRTGVLRSLISHVSIYLLES